MSSRAHTAVALAAATGAAAGVMLLRWRHQRICLSVAVPAAEACQPGAYVCTWLVSYAYDTTWLTAGLSKCDRALECCADEFCVPAVSAMHEQLKQCPLIRDAATLSAAASALTSDAGGYIELMRLSVPRYMQAKLEAVLRLACSSLEPFHVCFTDLSISISGKCCTRTWFRCRGWPSGLAFSEGRPADSPKHGRPLVCPCTHGHPEDRAQNKSTVISAECHQASCEDIQRLTSSLLQGVKNPPKS